jgi:hypothetical protein
MGTIEINGNKYREYIDDNTEEAFLCQGSAIIAETQTHHGLNEVWFYGGNADDVGTWAKSYFIEKIVLCGRR